VLIIRGAHKKIIAFQLIDHDYAHQVPEEYALRWKFWQEVEDAIPITPNIESRKLETEILAYIARENMLLCNELINVSAAKQELMPRGDTRRPPPSINLPDCAGQGFRFAGRQ